ncbi:MAG TPA: glycosyltransferase family 1 protein [Terriglobales bacterium]|nr:glycosyltransferase family 1 protein [Terriglobales bacterium]
MKIALDPWVLSSRFRNHGVYVYAHSLFQELARSAARHDVEFCLFTSRSNHNDAVQIAGERNFHHRPAPLLAHKHLWRVAGASMAARGAEADLLFAPSATVVPFGIPVICTIHDATPLWEPSSGTAVALAQRILLRSAAAASRAVIAVSQCSRRDLVDCLRVPESKIAVVYPGYDKASFNAQPPNSTGLQNLLSRLQISRPYILHHGVIQPRKNLRRLIEAYRLLISQTPGLDLELVLAGPLGWKFQEVLDAAKQPNAPGRVVLTGALPQHELALLVKGATLAIVPSLYEGFCMPLVESMACGTPTIASNTSCLPEVSGSTLLYFHPLSVDDMAACMKRAIEDSRVRDAIARRGQEFVLRYDWQHCADETVEVLKKAA